MNFSPTTISGCFQISPKVFTDNRGSFVKTFHRDLFEQQGLEPERREEFCSENRKVLIQHITDQILKEIIAG